MQSQHYSGFIHRGKKKKAEDDQKLLKKAQDAFERQNNSWQVREKQIIL